MEIQLSFEMFRRPKLHVPINILEFGEGFPFEFEMARKLV
jgi:hypothetical protein